VYWERVLAQDPAASSTALVPLALSSPPGRRSWAYRKWRPDAGDIDTRVESTTPGKVAMTLRRCRYPGSSEVRPQTIGAEGFQNPLGGRVGFLRSVAVADHVSLPALHYVDMYVDSVSC